MCSDSSPPPTTACSSKIPQVSLNLSTPNSAPLTEFLIYPAPVKRANPKPANKSAHIWTSPESRAILEEKTRKKEEEEEEARKKNEREAK